MNAKIDIVTPSGKSLEGFPNNFTAYNNLREIADSISDACRYGSFEEPTLHPGDKIIIEILPDK